MNIISIINTMVVLFGILIVGYVLNKIKILDEPTNKKISELVVKVTAPMLVIGSVCSETF